MATMTELAQDLDSYVEVQETTELERLKADTLAWCQEFNPGLKEMPRGLPMRAQMCPVARGLGDASVVPDHTGFRGGGGWSLRHGRDRVSRRLPDRVNAFAVAFDGGKYPELIEKGD